MPRLSIFVLQFLIVLLGMGVMHGLMPILTSETFPTKFRYSGSGISFGLAGVLGGMIALLFLRETRDIKFEDLDNPPSNVSAPRLSAAAAND